MTAVAEQVAHLLGGQEVAVLDAVDPDHPGADPTAGGLALRLVVVGQPGAAEFGRIGGGDLAGQVFVPRPGRELLQRHRHTPQGRSRAASGHPDPSVKEVCSEGGGAEKGAGSGWAGMESEAGESRGWKGKDEREEMGWPLEDIP